MKKISAAFLVSALFLVSASLAGAATYTFQPTPNDLWNLDHGYYYTWGINWSVPAGETIVGASLFFDDIRNYDNSENHLWVHLLDSATAGTAEGTDSNDNVDYFADYPACQHILLNYWHNLSDDPLDTATNPSNISRDITYDFKASQLDTLTDYLTDGNFGLGFDPDCHFYNNGITLTIETAHAPVPASVLLLGSGLLGLVGFKRKTRKSKI